jgi:hypothetical protein
MDPSIEVGSLVVVPTSTRYNMTVCLVTEIDEHLVDLFQEGKDLSIKWIVCKIDTTEYDALREQDRIKLECPNATYLDSLNSISEGLPSQVSGAPSDYAACAESLLRNEELPRVGTP